jgi:hypothetical protein
MGISYQCSIYTCNGCGDVYEYEDGKLDNTGAFTCKQCLMIKRLMNLNAAEIAFSGLGLFDIFKPTRGERVYVGSVLLDLDNPPFFVGEGIYFKYAPGFVLFPRGVVGLTPVVGDAASPLDSGEQTRASEQAGEGATPHPPRA